MDTTRNYLTSTLTCKGTNSSSHGRDALTIGSRGVIHLACCSPAASRRNHSVHLCWILCSVLIRLHIARYHRCRAQIDGIRHVHMAQSLTPSIDGKYILLGTVLKYNLNHCANRPTDIGFVSCLYHRPSHHAMQR